MGNLILWGYCAVYAFASGMIVGAQLVRRNRIVVSEPEPASLSGFASYAQWAEFAAIRPRPSSHRAVEGQALWREIDEFTHGRVVEIGE